MFFSRKVLVAAGAAVVLAGVISLAGARVPVSASGGGQLFVRSAVEHADGTVTLPLHRGASKGQTVYYIILDASDGGVADSLGVNRAQKLANAANTGAVQKVTVTNGVVNFPGTVDFSPVRSVVAGPTGFPPNAASPGAVGDSDYSPLIQLPDGTVESAPQIANNSGRADKIVSLDTVNMKVTLRETNGFQGGNAVRYLSTDASDPGAAALENSTYAPKLNAAPTVGDDSTDSSRASLAAFTNGQTGVNNPQRQGLSSAILDGQDPLNVLRWNPSQGRYSPLWDVHLAQWSQAAVAGRQNVRQTDWGDVQGLADHGQIASFNGTPQGAPFAAAGFIVLCPIISMQ